MPFTYADATSFFGDDSRVVRMSPPKKVTSEEMDGHGEERRGETRG